MIIDRLIERIGALRNPSVVGLDTCAEHLPDEMRARCTDAAHAAEAVTEFNFRLIDALADIVPAVKVQIAYYETYGAAGLRAFADTLAYARAKGMFVIADAKRNDIGSTAAAYSRAFLGKTPLEGGAITPFECDFLTVNGYLGSDGVLPFVKDCEAYDKGLFVLVKTSNPTSGELQDLRMENGRTLYDNMACLTERWGASLVGKYGYSSVGAVVGATHKEQAAAIRKAHPSLFFLIPGYGAQGGTAADLSVCFREGSGGIVNSSRAILTAYRKSQYAGKDFVAAAVAAALDMKKDLSCVC